MRQTLCDAFVSSGFNSCVQAENGARALEQAARVKPSAVILDLSMPIMHGLEAAPLLRAILPHTPIILYTIHDTPELRQLDLSKLGISLLVSKREPLKDLVAKVNRLLRAVDHSC